MAERIIGIDFGTSTSVIRIKRYDDNGKSLGERLDVKEVSFGIGTNVAPTLIRRVGEAAYYGHEALSPKKKSKLYQNFKIDLENENPFIREEARKNTEEFFGYMFKAYSDQSDGGHLGESSDNERTIVSYPVKWKEETRSFMLEAAQKAGFKNVEGMDEAQAAIQAIMVQSADYLKQKGYLRPGKPANILMIDMGAGTTDLVLCRYQLGSGEPIQIMGTWPKRGEILFGGHEMDEILRDYIKTLIPGENADKILDRCGIEKFKSWKEQMVSPALARKETVNEFGELDNILDYSGMEIEDYNLSRETLESVAESYLQKLPLLVKGCIQNAGITGDQIDLVILTGGHSQWYFMEEILAGKMKRLGAVGLSGIQREPDRIVKIARPQETVALGLVYGPLLGEEGETEETDISQAKAGPEGTSASQQKAGPEDASASHAKAGQEGTKASQQKDGPVDTKASQQKDEPKESTSIFTIRTETAPGGSIVPAGPIKAREGEYLHFDIKPEAGYRVSYLQIGDTPVQVRDSVDYVVKSDSVIRAGFQKVQNPPPVQTPSVPHCYGDLVKEFINTVKAPPARNRVANLSDLYKRQMREFWELPENEEIIYSPSGRNMLRYDTFYFTKKGISAGKKRILNWEKFYMSWEDFAKAKIEPSNKGNTFLKFNNNDICVKTFALENAVHAQWRYFYIDLQRYLNKNADRLK